MLPAGELPLAEALREGAAKPAGDERFPYPGGEGRPLPQVPWRRLVSEPARGAQLAAAIGSAPAGGPALAQAVQRLPGEAALEAALVVTSQAQLVVLAMLIEKDKAFSGQQRQLWRRRSAAEAVQQVDRYHEAIAQLPPGMRCRCSTAPGRRCSSWRPPCASACCCWCTG